MNVFADLKQDTSIQGETDSLGGSYILESDAYTCKIKLAYVTVSASGARGLVIHTETQDGKEFRTTQWVTSGKEKGGLPYFINQKGDKQYLPGYLHSNAIALLTTGKELAELDMEDKVVNVYSAEAKKEVPTSVKVPVELLGKDILFGILKQVVDKTEKDASGNYVPTGETREENELNKVFRARDGLTTTEILAKQEEPVFLNQWIEKFKGTVKDKTKKNSKPSGVKTGSPVTTTTTPTKSLFA